LLNKKAGLSFSGSPLKILTVVNECARECLAISVEPQMQPLEVLEW